MKDKPRQFSRREFLNKSVLGAAVVGAAPYIAGAKTTPTGAENNEKNKIVQRVLGRTGIKVPVISLGCGSTGNPAIVRAALDMGMTHLDTAHYYSGGKNETMIGSVIKDRPRESFVIATKFILPTDNRTGDIDSSFTPQSFNARINEMMDISLQRLGLKYVDILYIHAVNQPKLVAEPMVKAAFQDLKEKGKTRFIGVSTHQDEPPVIDETVKQKIYDVVLTAYNFRQPHREAVKKSIANAAAAGLGVIGMKVMAGTYWDKARKHPIDINASFKWILQNENIHTIIPGVTTFDQLEKDWAVMKNLRMTPEEKAHLEMGEKLAMSGLYCSQCAQCSGQCTYGLDIPVAMRSYMYAYGHRNPAKARETMEMVERSTLNCRSCSNCRVQCPMGFDVQDKMTDIIRLMDIPAEFLT